MLSAIHLYRFSRWAYKRRIPLVPRFVDYISRAVFACWIPHKARIGADVVVGYGGLGIVIHDDVIIGERTHIDQGVTIGGNARTAGVANVGRDVYIGAGAKILGPVMIGDGSVIGANAVVTKDVPASSVAVGIPARIVKTGIRSDEFLFHRRERL